MADLSKILPLIAKKKYDEIIEILYKIRNKLRIHGYNHDVSNQQLDEMFGSEKTDDLFPSYLIIHLTRVLSMLSLNSKKETASDRREVVYHTLVCDTKAKIKLFFLYLELYRELSEREKRCFVGFDYEFNNRKIALMQICFESPGTEGRGYSGIFIIDPKMLDDEMMEEMINKLMINPKIHRIFHGADSLDIPYTLNEMLAGNTDRIDLFLDRFIDTRFLCEYYRSSIDDGKKCSIYDALLYFGTISQKKYDYLVETHDAMGPIQDISWNIHKMSSHHTKYAMYDVLFLKQFAHDIYKKAEKTTPQYFRSYEYINHITRFVLKERREVTDATTKIKKMVDVSNNYMIHANQDNITLITVYNTIIDSLLINRIGMNINHLLGINFFRTHMIMLFKLITYASIIKNHKVFVRKNVTLNTKIHLEDVYRMLLDNKYKKLVYVLKLVQIEIEKKLALLIK